MRRVGVIVLQLVQFRLHFSLDGSQPGLGRPRELFGQRHVPGSHLQVEDARLQLGLQRRIGGAQRSPKPQFRQTHVLRGDSLGWFHDDTEFNTSNTTHRNTED